MIKSSYFRKNPWKTPEFFRKKKSTWKGKWTTIYYKLANTSTTQHKPMVVLGSIELSRIGKI